MRSVDTFHVAHMLRLQEALEASWSCDTAYRMLAEVGNAALGQGYPTARVVQHYYPATEIIKGTVWTRESEEIHFWNGLPLGDAWYHIDFTWQQFPAGSMVREFAALDREALDDSDATIERCALLLKRVEDHLRNAGQSTPHTVHIPFKKPDVLLGRPVRLDIESLLPIVHHCAGG